MHNKRIICDLDDTISTTKNRDFENATPIKPVIEKINHFYELGFEVIIETARGQLSCNGDASAADKKYRAQIEDWLFENSVKYHSLSFNKRLAQFYIDDKALSPDSFLRLETEEMKGRSGDYVFRAGDYVYKTTPKSKEELNWYSISESNFSSYKTPRVNSLVGETICMEFIHDNKDGKIYSILNGVKSILSEFKAFKVGNKDWSSYIERVSSHIAKNDLPTNILTKLDDITSIMNEESSFSHGDMTLENIIYHDHSVYLIDSIFNKSLYSSYLLDLSKLLYSLKYNKMEDEYNYFINHYSSITDFDEYFFKLLESTHWIRVYSYLKDENEKKEYLNQIKQYNEFFK